MLSPEEIAPMIPDWVGWVVVLFMASPFALIIFSLGAWFGGRNKE